jgi:hypothetical protein
VLVRQKEPHELRHLDDLEMASLVDVKVRPGLIEVITEVGSDIIFGEILVRAEDFLGGSLSANLVEPERTGRLAVRVVFFTPGVLDTCLLLKRVLGDHRAHEDISAIFVLVRDGSLVFTVFAGLPRLIPVASELDHGVIIRVRLTRILFVVIIGDHGQTRVAEALVDDAGRDGGFLTGEETQKTSVPSAYW